jgi:outer membrane immunogenic protein
MKKLVLALAAVAAFSGSALAADLPPAPAYTKAPVMPAPVYNWTGFYIFGGGGYGVWAADETTQNTFTGNCITCINQRQGGAGWYGTVGAGYDWQVNSSWVVGIFGDGQFGSISGSILDQNLSANVGTVKMQDAYAGGARVGYLVAPNVLSYVNAGYSGAHWSGTTWVSGFTGNPNNIATNAFNRNGWFLGGGVENNLNIFGITAPGWFMKTEYRGAYYGKGNISELNATTGALLGTDVTFKPFVQTISTSLVYRFNWGGPVVAKY